MSTQQDDLVLAQQRYWEARELVRSGALQLSTALEAFRAAERAMHWESASRAAFGRQCVEDYRFGVAVREEGTAFAQELAESMPLVAGTTCR